MPILDDAGARVRDVALTRDSVSFALMDGRTISAPIAWFPRLLKGSRQQRANWRIVGSGIGVHWPELDEDISPVGLLRGEIPTIADHPLPHRGAPTRKTSRASAA
ncbi:MAG: DUF2442 domain-containing protein [Proteobacteria bacterium]|nr:DUF2442 domain-containing protein [Pseudomonadota bacterium]